MATKRDAVIIGGGIIGCSIAYYLAKKGIRPIVVERRGVGEGTSSACDGFIFMQTKKPGLPLTLAMESAGIYQTLSKELGSEVYYQRPGGLILIETEEQLAVMEEVVANQKKCGMEVEIISGDDARKMEPYLSKNIAAAAYSALDGHADPIATTLAFAKKAKELGAEFWTHTQVTGITVKNGAVRGVQTSRGEIETECAVVAAGAWSPFIGEMVGLDVPIRPRRGQTMVTEPLPPIFHKELLCARYIAIKHHPELAKGSDDPGLKLGVGLSIEQTEHGNLLIGNNREFAGYDVSTSFEVLREVCNYVTRFVPFLKDVNIIRTFSGLRPFCEDGSPIIGATKALPGLIFATGHEGDGIALAPITGELVSDLIKEGKTKHDISSFSSDRFIK